jgi:RimJ/RimL family protein N-acetyltransferase
VLALREATLADAALLRGWRNDPTTREASRHTAEVSEQEHAEWLERVLDDPNRLLLVAEEAGRPVGQLRLDREDDRWEISVSLDEQARGRGLGTALIDAGVEQLAGRGGKFVEAWVRTGNEVSVRSFRRAGFEAAPELGGAEFTVLTREL